MSSLCFCKGEGEALFDYVETGSQWKLHQSSLSNTIFLLLSLKQFYRVFLFLCFQELNSFPNWKWSKSLGIFIRITSRIRTSSNYIKKVAWNQGPILQFMIQITGLYFNKSLLWLLINIQDFHFICSKCFNIFFWRLFYWFVDHHAFSSGLL